VPEVAFRLADVQEIGGTEPIHHRLNPARFFQIVNVAFELGHAAARAQQRHQVTAGRGAPGGKFVRVQVVFDGVGPQPAHGRLAVVNLGRELRFLAETVSHVCDRVAVPGKGQRRAGAILAARQPGAAVNPNDERHRFLSLLGNVKVEPHRPAAALTIFQIL